MIRASGKCWSLLWLCWLLLANVQALARHDEMPVRLFDARNAAWLADPTGQLQVDAVAQGALPVQPLNEVLNRGYNGQDHWLRLQLPDDIDRGEWLLGVLPAYLDHIELYLPAAGRGWQYSAGAMRTPFRIATAPPTLPTNSATARRSGS